MKEYSYNGDRTKGIMAEFSFTDVDGNKVTGSCSDCNLYDLLDKLSYSYLCDEHLHPVKNSPIENFNGIADIRKTISITINPSK